MILCQHSDRPLGVDNELIVFASRYSVRLLSVESVFLLLLSTLKSFVCRGDRADHNSARVAAVSLKVSLWMDCSRYEE